MTQCLRWLNSTLLVNGQHSFQQINEFSSINFLCQQLTAFNVHLNIDLADVIETIEDVLASLFALYVSHDFILFGRYQSPERICGVLITIEKLFCFAGTVQHVFGG